MIPIRTPRSPLAFAIDVALTLVAWALFVWLLFAGGLSLLVSADGGPRPTFGISMLETLHTLVLYLVIGVFNALILYAWAGYNAYRYRRERRRAAPALTERELAESFAVPPDVCTRLQRSRVVTVRHDEQGGLAQVVSATPL